MSFEGLQDAPHVSDRREVLSNLLDEAEKTQNVSHETPVKSEPVAPKTSEDRPRDEAGKFAAKTAAPAPKAPELPLETSPVEPPLWERPPKSWKPDKHALWSTATPELKQYAYTREEEMRAGVEPLLPKAQLADQITKAAEPYMNTIRGMGLELPAAVEGLMKADHELRTLPPEQKLQKLIGLANYYGIRLDGAQQPQTMADPQVYGLHNELLSMKGELANWKQQQEEIANRSVLNEINNFARGKDHFEIARPFMVDLLHKSVDDGGATSLEEAYEKVTGPGGVLHDLIEASKQAAAIPNQRTALDKAAKTARAAAVSVKSSTPGPTATTKAQSRRDVLAEAFSNIDSRL